jgi:hypothetical protein
VLRFRLGSRRLQSLRRARVAATMEATAVTRDATDRGVTATVPVAVRPPSR